MTPKRENVRFYPSAAAAQQAGFRACKRCRPDATPGSPEWDGRADVVARAMRLIADGVVDRSGVPGLAAAARLQRPPARAPAARRGRGRADRARSGPAGTDGARADRDDGPARWPRWPSRPGSRASASSTTPSAPSSRHPDRDCGPRRDRLAAAVARTRPPARSTCASRSAGRCAPTTSSATWRATAVPGVEEVVGGTYRRTLRLAHGPGIVELPPHPTTSPAACALPTCATSTSAIARCRWLLDLDADPVAVDELLGARPRPRARWWPRRPGGGCPALRRRCRARGPGRARPAGLDRRRPHARRARSSPQCGEPVERPRRRAHPLFPTPDALRGACDLAHARRPRAAPSPRSPARCARDASRSTRAATAPRRCGVLAALPGIGPWTAAGDRHAGPRRPRRLPGRRPRGAPRGAGAWPAGDAGRARRPRRALAALARLRRAVPVGGQRPPDQPLAAAPVGDAVQPSKPDQLDRLHPKPHELDPHATRTNRERQARTTSTPASGPLTTSTARSAS